MDDRMVDGPAPVQKEPLTPRQRVNLTLRWLGIILPLAITYPVFSWILDGFQRGSGGFLALVATAAGLWIAFTVALAWRRDWAGAAAISAFYLVVDAWWWLLALEVIGFG
ncbi:MAG: hypothetical protein JW990_13740 [Thermoleophilia bacterium]|nr:hypothetical protein [Thermoleophilia bacterium]